MISKAIIIGSGKVAKAIVPQLLKNGIQVLQLFSRRPQEVDFIKNGDAQHSVEIISDYVDISDQADIYILAVKDDALSEVSEKLSQVISSDKYVCHLSGSLKLEVLDSNFSKKICFWPMYSFIGHEVDWQKVPLFVTSNIKNEEIYSFGKTLSPLMYSVTEEEKSKIHIAAVFANNFSNYNLHIAEEILKTTQIPLSVFKPMMEGMLNGIFEKGALLTQTGPAHRGDLNIVENQFIYLQEHFPEFALLYQQYSKLISQKK